MVAVGQQLLDDEGGVLGADLGPGQLEGPGGEVRIGEGGEAVEVAGLVLGGGRMTVALEEASYSPAPPRWPPR